MDMADDIAYSTYDLEDAMKAGFLSPLSIYSMTIKNAEEIAASILDVSLTAGDVIRIVRDTFEQLSEPNRELPPDLQIAQAFEASAQVASDGYLRTALTSELVSEFVSNVEFTPNEKCPALSKAKLCEPTRAKVEVLKRIAYRTLIMNPRLRAGHLRGIKIVSSLLEVMMKETRELLPDDFSDMHARAGAGGIRVICDFVAGMTDRYALEFYGRLTSMTPITVFKPL